MIIMIAFKGAIRDFFVVVVAISSLRREPSPTSALKIIGQGTIVCKSCATSSAYHMEHVVLRATWNEDTAQLFGNVRFGRRPVIGGVSRDVTS